MKKFAILAGLMTLALFIGVAGTSLRADKAEARPTDVISFSPDVCVFLASDRTIGTQSFDGCDCQSAGGIGASDNAIYVCNHSLRSFPTNLAEALADALDGAVDDPDTYAHPG